MVSEFKVAIVGCGALGFRYLQAVLSSSVTSDIIVIDKSLESLAIAQKYISDQGFHSVRLSTSLSDLSSHLDLCIVATTASSRLSIVRQILDMSSIGYLILEKVIEQSTFNCLSFLNLIPPSTQSYVNLWPAYWKLPKILNSSLDMHSPITINVSGHQWNLASNAIHFLYLFNILGATHTKLSSDEIISHYPQKRPGFYDCIGKLSFISDNDSSLTLVSTEQGVDPGDFIIHINQADTNWTFSSSSGFVTSHNNIFQCPIPYTSEFMTTQVLSAYNGSSLDLAPLSTSIDYQCLLLNSLESYFARCGIVQNVGILPIT